MFLKKSKSQTIESTTKLWCIGVICVAVFMPIFYSWGHLLIGGDNLIPFYSKPLNRYLYQWLDQRNGFYVSGNYFPLQLFYVLLEEVTSNVYQKGAIFLVTLRIISAFGIYLLLRLIYQAKLNFQVTFSIVFYLLSPIYFNGHHYLVIYYFIPLLFYFPAKIIQRGLISWFDVLMINVLLFFGSVDLPNPKYIFYFILMAGVTILMGCLFRKIGRKFFMENKYRIVLAVLISSYILVPQAIFVLNYNPNDYGIAVKKEYKSDANIEMMDFGSATGAAMVRLHHDGMVVSPEHKRAYLSNPLVTLASYSFILLIVLYILKKREKVFFDYLLIVLLFLFMLLSIGPNPPLGFIYEYLVTSFGVLGFLRTTAGAVFFLSLFYALILYAALRFFSSKILNIGIWMLLAVVSHQMLSGEHFRNWSPVNPYVNKNSFGMKVPEEYFGLKTILDSKQLDSRVYLPGADPAYINNKWGYFGPFTFYRYLLQSDIQDQGWLFHKPARQSVGYIINDKSLMRSKDPVLDESQLYSIRQSGFLDLYGTNLDYFVPRVYSFPRLVFSSVPGSLISSGWKKDIPSIRVQSEHQKYFKGPLTSPKIEFKRINSSKYRIVFHNVKDDFLVVLSETYNEQWKLYIGDYKLEKQPSALLEKQSDRYKIFHNNKNEQAGKQELAGLLNEELITTLGDGEIKSINHYRYTSESKTLEVEESYRVGFVSRQFFGTIQNNNLPNNTSIEEIKIPAEAARHLKVDFFANGWLINKNYIETRFSDRIIRNSDKSFDFVLTAEFLPARYFRQSAIFSLALVFIVVILGIRGWVMALIKKQKGKLA